MDAAATLMYHNGVSTTSLDDVLTAAGAGKGQMYHYFDGKADLVAAVIERQ
ncbi:TetR/AcrR family transcriptional regulator, partial [Mycobacteroides abscessus]